MIDLRELVWGDVFAGFGGTSTGFKNAFGREPDFAINHWDLAIQVHDRNHPETEHHRESVWRLDPDRVIRGRQVGGLWFSPDCTHFSSVDCGNEFYGKGVTLPPDWAQRSARGLEMTVDPGPEGAKAA